MRADKKKSLAKVTKTILNNPLSTEREIAVEAWVSNWTAHNMIKELEQTWAKDDRIIGLTDEDFEIQQLIQEETRKRITKNPDKIRDVDLKGYWEFALKRYTLFRWDVTDKDGWLKQIDSIDIL